MVSNLSGIAQGGDIYAVTCGELMGAPGGQRTAGMATATLRDPD